MHGGQLSGVAPVGYLVPRSSPPTNKTHVSTFGRVVQIAQVGLGQDNEVPCPGPANLFDFAAVMAHFSADRHPHRSRPAAISPYIPGESGAAPRAASQTHGRDRLTAGCAVAYRCSEPRTLLPAAVCSNAAMSLGKPVALDGASVVTTEVTA